ncbi:hypothetical protein O999_05660 [Pseudomonas putida LF54]|uniref:Uncharacterized protein n=1 Tax=Pseudomonas putida TaxID=303 RepID=A0A2S3WLX6_PSEPU|nr:hypothetical protein O999_05660 [Pseudomonas putida LF54]POF94054.1 hypothetical protein BGP83_15655 [Pseudomonas putida]POG02382.1 hypothetical protein BGP82_13665 [Pseudomonas putida]
MLEPGLFAAGGLAMNAMRQALSIQGQCQLPALDTDIDQAALAACNHLKVMHAKRHIAQALVDIPGAQ